jgi:hypothetical protein
MSMKCGRYNFCLGFEPDHKVYCYGSNQGCLWNQNSCNTDQDCTNKYNTSSPKYSNGDVLSCTNITHTDWRLPDACPDTYAEQTIIQTVSNQELSGSGLTYYAYDNNNGFNNYNSDSDFSIFNTKPIKTGTITKINNSNDTGSLFSTYGFSSDQYIALKFNGYFTPNVSGRWGFLMGDTTSNLPNDDLSYLWIGDNVLNPTPSNANGMCYYYSSFSSAYVYVELIAGKSYPILMYWGQSWGGFGVSLGIIPPGGSLTYDGSNYFSVNQISLSCKSTDPTWSFSESLNNWYILQQNGYNTSWSNTGISTNKNMSVSFWLNISSLYPDWRNIFHVSNSDSNSRVPSLWIAPNDTYFSICNSTESESYRWESASTLGLNIPIFITIVWSDTTIYYYINGDLNKTYSVPSYIKPNSNATLYISDPWYAQDKGVSIKNFSLYNCSLSAENISLIYNLQLTTSCTSISPTWKLQDSFNDWYKIKQNGYSAKWSTIGIENNSNMSISFWLNITSLYPYWRNLFHLTNTNKNCCDNGDRVPGVWITPKGTSIFISSSTNSNNDDAFVTSALPSKTQLFITIVWSNKNVYVYVNSTLNSQFTHSSSLTFANSNAFFYIGDPWHGQNGGLLIKFFSVYNCSLSVEKISSIYNSQLSTLCDYQLSSTELECYKNNYPQNLTNMNNLQLQNHWTTIGCKENRNNQCSSQQNSSGLYKYKGCYNDIFIRAIPTFDSNVSSVDECAQIAENKNQNVFGVQYNGECWTGLNEQQAYQYGVNYNKDACPTLGGTWTNQVYARSNIFSAPSAPVPYLTNPNFANNENIENFLNEEKKNENLKIIFKYIIITTIIILLLIFINRMLSK